MLSESPPEITEPDDLYSLPLEQFTAARGQLAKRLAAEGKDDEAGSVAKLHKPSVAAWALNRAARRHPEAVERLRASHRELRAATSATQLQEASEERQRSVTDLAALAVRELTAEGRPMTGATKDRITSTLLAVATDPEGEADLTAGRLVRDIEPSGGGWGDLGLIPATPAPPASRSKSAAEKARAKADRLEKEARAAEQRVEGAKRALDEAKRRAKEMRVAADLAVAEAEAAEAGPN